MKKLTAVILALALAASFCACGTAKPEEPSGDVIGGLANPVTEYESLDALNEELKSGIVPLGIEGIDDEQFLSIDCGEYKIAEYRFTLDGVSYGLRNASVLDDISGYYVDEATAFGEPQDDIEFASVDGCELARWFNIEGQFVLSATNPDDSFKDVADRISKITLPNYVSEEEYEGYEGSYFDSVSQRATMTVENGGDETLKLTVSWSNSAFETVEWTMTGHIYEDGLLTYKDCKKTVYNYEDEEEKATVEYENGEGFFSPSEGKLLWTGAAEEECAACVFEKAE